MADDEILRILSAIRQAHEIEETNREWAEILTDILPEKASAYQRQAARYYQKRACLMQVFVGNMRSVRTSAFDDLWDTLERGLPNRSRSSTG